MTEPVMGSVAARPLGRVSLVGAGPGDAELLTLKAARLLAEADVVVISNMIVYLYHKV